MSPARHSGPLHPIEEREFVPFLHELIGAAFEVIVPRFLSNLAVDTKADHSPVTLADREAERVLRERIAGRYPGHAIRGEEFGEREGRHYRWILDPIDGTRAFIHNCFLFGTLIALERDDGAGYRPVLGCIAHAAAGLALVGHRDATTLYRTDGTQRRVRVRAPRPLAQATVLTTTVAGSAEQGGESSTQRVTSAAAMTRTWGDCFGYFSLATGGADAMLDPQLSYWDVAAVIPVVEGAGGAVSGWRGGDPLQELSLVAATPELHETIVAMLRAEEAP
jgi:histidinol phosphatase-like enzyme (inositol monophosphatase family)